MIPMDFTFLRPFLSGAIMMGYWVAGLFFIRFWKKTGDRLFRNFAWALWVLGAERAIILVTRHEGENMPYYYLLRLASFILLLIAIIRKNQSPIERPSPK
jgi:hypothetical protein